MIATCKFCLSVILPTGVIGLKPAVLAKIPPAELELLKFSAAVTEHIRDQHPEFLQTVQRLAGNFIGHCQLSTVDPVGDTANEFRARSAGDDMVLRAYWESMPNPPHPDVMAQLQIDVTALVDAARTQDAHTPAVGGNMASVVPGKLIVMP